MVHTCKIKKNSRTFKGLSRTRHKAKLSPILRKKTGQGIPTFPQRLHRADPTDTEITPVNWCFTVFSV